MREKLPLSIIVPVYNMEKYLPKCLDSIMAQTLKDFELICVNDGSTDESQRVLEEYAARDSRISQCQKSRFGRGLWFVCRLCRLR